MARVTKGFSLNQFNEVAACDAVFDVVLKDADGNEISDGDGGILTVSIIGSESKTVTDFDKRITKKVIADVWQKKAKGDKFFDRPDIDNAQQIKIARLQVIVKKWALSDDCTPENIELFFTQNPTFQKQVEDASADLRNFLPIR